MQQQIFEVVKMLRLLMLRVLVAGMSARFRPTQLGQRIGHSPSRQNATAAKEIHALSERQVMKSHLRPLLMLFAAIFLVFTTGLSAAQAASPHFKKNGSPVCTITTSGASASTTCRAVIAGLGNDDLLATVTTSGFAVYQCQNQGGNVAPGQNKVLVGPATAPTEIDSGAFKNGNLTLVTEPALLTTRETVTGAEAGCPNPNWTGVNPVLTVTSILLVIEQPVGEEIFRCSASNSTGLTGQVALTC
ncbi:hypothetical protein [Arthrobacter cavernae]|uniref:Uncharacterized protein n=1 Tax=Arthrobacter cavernae TaxID=2817681 RepID=A0A939HGW0_9MICC|nr:hypothetical protein [Arthrobacter cavernae]MBO1269691.1 hypothetical protein [Arthrobacter cavernae]